MYFLFVVLTRECVKSRESKSIIRQVNLGPEHGGSVVVEDTDIRGTIVLNGTVEVQMVSGFTLYLFV